MAKPVRIIGVPDNQRPDKWSLLYLSKLTFGLAVDVQADDIPRYVGRSIQAHSFTAQCVVRLKIGPSLLLPQRVIHRERSSVSPYNFHHPLVSLR